MLYVGIGVVFRTGGSVDRFAVVGEELQLGECLAILGMCLTIEHK